MTDVSMTDAMQSGDDWSDDDAASDWSGEYINQSTSHSITELPRCFDQSLLIDLQDSMINRASLTLDIESAAACTMLRHCHWNEQKLIDCFQSDSDGEFINQCGVSHSLHKDLSDVISENEVDCPICFDTISGERLIGLPCHPDHRVCTDCLKSYLVDAVVAGSNDGGSVLNTTCPQSGCNERVGYTVFEMLLDDEDLIQQYKNQLINSFVDDSDVLTWCPACPRVLRLNQPSSSSSSTASSPTLACDCCETFCVLCKQQAHAPSTCNEALQWAARDKGTESVDAKYLIENSKPCPKCGSRTEKHGGCMYMTCARCAAHWCWVCGLGDHHVWECQRKTYSHDDDDDTKTMKRYLDYYERFFEHGRSLTAIQGQVNKVQEKMSELVESGTHYKHAEFLIQASRVLLDARRVLRWSYVRRFYIEDETNAARLFEYRQKELERLVESLNQLTEGSIEELQAKRLTVLDFTKGLNSFVISFEADQAKARFIENSNKSTSQSNPSSPSNSEVKKPKKKKLKTKKTSPSNQSVNQSINQSIEDVDVDVDDDDVDDDDDAEDVDDWNEADEADEWEQVPDNEQAA